MKGINHLILPLALILLLLPYTTQAQATKADPQTEAKAKAQINAHEQDPDPAEANLKGLTPAIEQACNGEKNRALCISTFNAEPASKTADLKGLTFMSLNWTRTQAENVANWIDEKMANPENGAAVDQGLTDCSDMYTDAVIQLDEAVDSFATTTEFSDIVTFLSAAMSDADTCMEGLSDQKVIDLMGTHNQEFTKYCATSLNAVLSYENLLMSKGP